MKLLLIIIIQLFTGTVLFSQDSVLHSRPLNSIYVGLLGDLSRMSLNYERVTYIEDDYFLTSKIGVGINKEAGYLCLMKCGRFAVKYTTMPLHLSFCRGKGGDIIETGVGATVSRADIKGEHRIDFMSYFLFAYRLYPVEKGMGVFRFFIYIPITHTYEELSPFVGSIQYYPFGFSIGTAF